MKVKLEKYSEIYLNASWLWLNNPEVKRMTYTSDFTRDFQLKWFKNLKDKEDYKIWGIGVDNKPIGACGLKRITKVDSEYWGYIGEKKFWGKGLGKAILQLIEEEAGKLNLKYIWLKVLKENERALKLYSKSGYLIEKEEMKLIFMRKKLYS